MLAGGTSDARQTRRAREMARLVARWERSGLTQAAFARQIGMPAATFTWWRHRLRRAVRATPPAPGFTEVLAGPPVRAEVEVVLRNGRLVRVPLGAECGAVRRLVEALDAVRHPLTKVHYGGSQVRFGTRSYSDAIDTYGSASGFIP